MTAGEFFGTLQECITAAWRSHLKTNKYSKHMALDEFYKEMPEKVDALIEAYQADNENITDYKNLLAGKKLDALEMIYELRLHVRQGRKEICNTTELQSLCDDVLAQITSTMYKLEKLNESLSLYMRSNVKSIFEGMSYKAKKVMDLLKVADSKFKDPNKVTVSSTPKGNWSVYYDGKSVFTINGNLLDEETIDDMCWRHMN